ncbi:MAG: iron permease [Zetaproteobacteria bacterium]|nr:MAG: iron permease [Zetaproteobacteria bacterium]
MIEGAVIMFRELLEAALVLGVLAAATRECPPARRGLRWGALAGALAAMALGIGMDRLEASFSGEGEFLLHAVLLLSASVLLSWTVLWMRRYAAAFAAEMRARAERAVRADAPGWAVGIVAFAAVAREGSEAAFFLLATASTGEDRLVLAGAALGAAAALMVSVLLHKGLVRLPVRTMLHAVGWILLLMAAGMAGRGVWNLVVIGWLPPLIDEVWDLSAWLPNDSVLGTMLGVLIGYDAAPSAMQLAVMAVVFALLAWRFTAASDTTPSAR